VPIQELNHPGGLAERRYPFVEAHDVDRVDEPYPSPVHE
jgi:hypothetical protein